MQALPFILSALVAAALVAATPTPQLFPLTFAGNVTPSPTPTAALFLNGNGATATTGSFPSGASPFYFPFPARLHSVSVATTTGIKGGSTPTIIRCNGAGGAFIEFSPATSGPSSGYFLWPYTVFAFTPGDSVICGYTTGTRPGSTIVTLWFSYTSTTFLFPLWFAGKMGGWPNNPWVPSAGFIDVSCSSSMLPGNTYQPALNTQTMPFDGYLNCTSSNVESTPSSLPRLQTVTYPLYPSFSPINNVDYPTGLPQSVTAPRSFPVNLVMSSYVTGYCIYMTGFFSPTSGSVARKFPVVFAGDLTSFGRLIANGNPSSTITPLTNWVISLNQFTLPSTSSTLYLEGVAFTLENAVGAFTFDSTQDNGAPGSYFQPMTTSGVYYWRFPLAWTSGLVSVRNLNAANAGKTILILLFSY